MSASSMIRPFPKTAMYATSWSNPLTFEQLYDDLAHYATCVMTSYGVLPHHLPECLQIGMMALWEQLCLDRTFLKTKTRRQAVFFILARCKIATLRYHECQYDRLEPLVEAVRTRSLARFALLTRRAEMHKRKQGSVNGTVLAPSTGVHMLRMDVSYGVSKAVACGAYPVAVNHRG